MSEASLRAARGLFVVLLATSTSGVACRSSDARRFEAEVMALDRKIDALRAAPNEAKAPLLEELERAPCERDAACKLKALCVKAYRAHLDGLAASARARSLLAEPDGGTLASIRAAQELSRAELELARAREPTEQCATEQGALRRSARGR